MTNYERLFGTPERAAETLARMDLDKYNWCVPEDCKACPYEFDYYGCYLQEKFSMLVWLKSEAVE